MTGAGKGDRVALVNPKGKVIARGKAGRFGSRIFRNLKPKHGYRVKSDGRRSKRFAVLEAGDNPKPRFYRRMTLRAGLNDVKVRDGIELAMTVRLPSGEAPRRRPVPDADRVLGLPGRGTARPALDDRQQHRRRARAGQARPRSARSSRPCSASPSSRSRCAAAVARAAPSAFSTSETDDGYDAVETVAAQDWVKGDKVGMAGISFSGISQLFTAGTRPPHLAAIAPMSVTDDLYTGTGNPGGIPNSGFARTWIQERMDDAEPAPKGGQPYARALVEQGDRHCRRNQRLRLQTQDAIALTERNPQRSPRLYDDCSPARWMSRLRGG